jgi:predicted TIM-barrel fold metal-dependent hydrolase
MLLSDYRPRSELVVDVHAVPRARFTAIDAHNHLGADFGGGWDRRPLSELLDVLDAAGVRVLVDLDGGFGEALLEAHLDRFKAKAPDRFLVFGGVDWTRFASEGDRFGEKAAARLREQYQRGAQGLKIWKPLGLTVKDAFGRRVPVDDARLDPLWATAGELSMPVTIHTGDPVAFFKPLDANNERYEELARHPDWHFHGPEFPSFEGLLGELSRLIERHPGTRFIGAHVAGYAENLAWVSSLLDRCPNLWVDIGARIAELGRQPNTTRRLLLRHPDRVLFGMDHPPSSERYGTYFRFLETDDDWFNPSDGEVPAQGRWFISGLALGDETLDKLYRKNAARVLGIEAPA